MTNRLPTPPDARTVIVGVDTHTHVHVAVAIDSWGIRLRDHAFVADSGGYQALITWAETHGRIDAFGIEGTGSYGASLARAVRRAGHRVLEVNRGDRRTRRAAGKSDTIDAEIAARSVLERISLGRSDRIAAMSKVVAAFGWIIAGHGGANCVPQDLPCATAGLAQDRLQLRKRQLNRIEVRTVFRQKPELRADGFDRSSHRGALVTREVVHDDDVARRERWRQDLLDVGQKTGAVDRAIKHGRRGEACHAQRPEKRRGVPAAIRRVVGDPGAGQPAAIAANQIGPHTTLIEKHEARGIERRRRGAPDRAGAADVSAIVFRRVYRFFLTGSRAV